MDVRVEAQDLQKRFQKRKVGQGPVARWFRRRNGGPGGNGAAANGETGWVAAVDGVSFQVRAGEIFGLLGPNGAGKTTTIRMLATLLEPTAGRALICGHDVRREPVAVRAKLGVVLAGERSLYWKLSGRENLEYFAALYHVPRAEAKARVRKSLEQMGLADRADELVERYSTGMKQRLSLARALLADPPVLLLDEPTLGLDPQAARNLRQTILELKAQGRAILLTTHYMEEADFLCDRVAIIDHGRIIALDPPAQLKRRLAGEHAFRLELAGAVSANGGSGNAAGLAARVPGLRVLEERVAPDGSATWIQFTLPDPPNDVPRLWAALAEEGLRVRNYEAKEPTLEDVFIALTGRALRD